MREDLSPVIEPNLNANALDEEKNHEIFQIDNSF